MLCAISGEAPQVPVASRKSGNVFEKRLIESYIADNGKDPVTGEDLTTDDLVELKNARVVRPRPPTLTSIPALLSTFQNEWDALALETYTLKQQLAQTRQELSTALYDFEGALRVIAKVSKERDEAREALSKVTVKGSVDGGEDAMQVDERALPDEIVAKIDATAQSLMATRRKRPIPEGWASAETIEAFEPTELGGSALPGSRALAIDAEGEHAIYAGEEGKAIVYVISKKKGPKTSTLDVGSGTVTDALFWDSKRIVALSTGEVKVFDKTKEIAKFEVHAGAATGLSLHPSGELLASVGEDQSYVIYDLTNSTQVTRVFTDSELTCGHFHPDGGLFAAAGKDSTIKLYDVKTGSLQASFPTDGPVTSLSFSENGTLLASASAESPQVSIWDLRHGNIVKTIDAGSAVSSIAWDYTGQFLAIGAAGATSVQVYEKKGKTFREVLTKGVNAMAVAWGKDAGSVVCVEKEGGIVTLS